MKRIYLTTTLTCLVILLLFYAFFYWINPTSSLKTVRVGFVYDNDESTAYTYNFSLAKDELQKQFGSQVEILTCSNVLNDELAEPLRGLAQKGCNIIFLNGYSPQVIEVAAEYPQVQFCQASYMDMSGMSVPANYHSFKGEAYQARYVTGVAAGMALRELLDAGRVTADHPLVGFVAAFPTSEVISGYTAFLMGIRSIVPEAVMHVRYTGTWSSFSLEKRVARELIDEGCAIISQHTDTIGPTLACEEAAGEKPVYFVAYNQSMLEIAPSTALIASRINWAPYITGAVKAVMNHKRIEKAIAGTVHGNDMSAGFERGWVEVLDLNAQLAAPHTEEKINEVIEEFRRGKKDFVFQGDYTGVNPYDPNDTIHLTQGYAENQHSSFPSFKYVLQDVIIQD